MTPGVLYVLRNRAFRGVVKVGGTARTAAERARELSTTGVPHPFEVVFSLEVSDWRGAESAVHSALRAHRAAHNREFFELTPQMAIAAVRRASQPFTLRDAFEDGDVSVVGEILRGRIVECNDDSRLELQWECPQWLAVGDERAYRDDSDDIVKEYRRELLPSSRPAQWIEGVACVRWDDELWSLTQRKAIARVPFADDSAVEVELFRKADSHRAEILALAERTSILGDHALALWDQKRAERRKLFGAWRGGHRSVTQALAAAEQTENDLTSKLTSLQRTSARWKSHWKRGFWAYRGKIYQVRGSGHSSREAGLLVMHFAEQQRARMEAIEGEVRLLRARAGSTQPARVGPRVHDKAAQVRAENLPKIDLARVAVPGIFPVASGRREPAGSGPASGRPDPSPARTEPASAQGLSFSIGTREDGTELALDLFEDSHILVVGGEIGRTKVLRRAIAAVLKRNDSNRESVELFLVSNDPKRFARYAELPGVMDVSAAPDEIAHILEYVRDDMLVRQRILAEYEVKRVDDLPDLFTRAVLVIDDVSVLVNELGTSSTIGEDLARLVEESLAAGIHLVVGSESATSLAPPLRSAATPHFHSRIACRLGSRADSMLAIDRAGAERLGSGEALVVLGTERPVQVRLPQ